jgi:hypothetical protein
VRFGYTLYLLDRLCFTLATSLTSITKPSTATTSKVFLLVYATVREIDVVSLGDKFATEK